MGDRPPESEWTIIHFLLYSIQDLLNQVNSGTIELAEGQRLLRDAIDQLKAELSIQISEIPELTAREVSDLLNNADSLMNSLLAEIRDNTYDANVQLTSLDDYLRNEIGYNIANMTADIDGMRDTLLYIGETLTAMPADIAAELSDEITGLQKGITDSLDFNSQLIIAEIKSGNADIAESMSGLKTELSAVIQQQTVGVIHSLDTMTISMTTVINKRFEDQTRVFDLWREETKQGLSDILNIQEEITDVQIQFYAHFWEDFKRAINSYLEFDPADVAAQMVQIIGAVNTLTSTMSTMQSGGER